MTLQCFISSCQSSQSSLLKKKQTHKSLLKKKHFAKVSHSKSPLRSWKPWTHPRCDDPNGYLPLAPASHRCQPFLDVFFAMTAFSHMPARKAIQLPRTHGGLWDSLLYTSNLKDSRGYGCKKDRIWINIEIYTLYINIYNIYILFIYMSTSYKSNLLSHMWLLHTVDSKKFG